MNAILVAALLLAAPLAARAGVTIQHWLAPSGARVYFVETRALPIVDVQVDFSAGFARDPLGKSGLAGLTRGLLEAGAGDLDEERLAARLVDIGARLDGATEADRAGLSLRTLSSPREREAAVALLRSVLRHPHFPEAALEREKARTVAALREAETRPEPVAVKRFFNLLYPGHPYGVAATPESVNSITRDDLVAFYRANFGARRAAVTIVGDLARAEAEALAENLTGGLPDAGPPSPLPAVTLPAAETVRVAHPASQAHLYLGVPAIRRGDPDYIPLLVGNYILGGGGFVSRLTKEVREKRGYAYSVYSYFHPMQEPGPFQIALQTKREQAADAMQVVEATLGTFLEEGPREAELRAAKRNLVDGFALRLDSNRKILDNAAVIGFYGLPLDWLDTFTKRIEAVSAAQVRAAFRRHVSVGNLVRVVVAGE